GQTAVPGTITTGAGDPYRSTSAGGAPGSVSINAGGPVDAPYSRLTVAESNANLTAFRPSDGAQGSLQLFPARAQLYTYNSGTATDGGELDISPNRLNISLAGTGGGSSSIAMGQRAINNTQAGISMNTNGPVQIQSGGTITALSNVDIVGTVNLSGAPL